ncbi:hypothetical protein NUM3379_22210 [Kineococcus sp. NUM-3379]
MDDDLDDRLARALGAGRADDLVDVGCDLAERGRHTEALRCFERAVELGAAWAWFDVANTLRDLDRPREAVPAYRRALAAGEGDAWLNLGLVLQDLGESAAAAEALRSAAEVAGQPEGWLALGWLLHEEGDQPGAEAAAARAAGAGLRRAAGVLAAWRWNASPDPASAPALEADLRAGAAGDGLVRAALADLLLATGRVAAARAELELGAKLGQRECWLPLGNLLADGPPDTGTGVDEDAAQDAYRAGIAAGDDNCHHNLGVLLLRRGDLTGARECFRAGAAAGDAVAEAALHRLPDG